MRGRGCPQLLAAPKGALNGRLPGLCPPQAGTVPGTDILSLHFAFGSPWARSYGTSESSSVRGVAITSWAPGLVVGEPGGGVGTGAQAPPSPFSVLGFVDERVGTPGVWMVWGPSSQTSIQRDVEASTAGVPREGRVAGPAELGRGLWGEARDTRSECWCGGGIWQTWGHPRPPVK